MKIRKVRANLVRISPHERTHSNQYFQRTIMPSMYAISQQRPLLIEPKDRSAKHVCFGLVFFSPIHSSQYMVSKSQQLSIHLK